MVLAVEFKFFMLIPPVLCRFTIAQEEMFVNYYFTFIIKYLMYIPIACPAYNRNGQLQN